MKCDEAIDCYMKLDRHSAVPLTVTVHLLRCKKCRSLVRALSKTANLYKEQFKYTEADNELIRKTMLKIQNASKNFSSFTYESLDLPQVHILPWIIVGVIMISGFAYIPFSPIGKWACSAFSLKFIIPFVLVAAGCVCIYSAIFVGCNLDFFVKKFLYPPNPCK